jgi:hypothetical protein
MTRPAPICATRFLYVCMGARGESLWETSKSLLAKLAEHVRPFVGLGGYRTEWW